VDPVRVHAKEATGGALDRECGALLGGSGVGDMCVDAVELTAPAFEDWEGGFIFAPLFLFWEREII